MPPGLAGKDAGATFLPLGGRWWCQVAPKTNSGDYSVILTVSGGHGQTDSHSQIITVTNVPWRNRLKPSTAGGDFSEGIRAFAA